MVAGLSQATPIVHGGVMYIPFGPGGSRQRRVGIVALARRLLIDLWRLVEFGVVPDGARLKTASPEAPRRRDSTTPRATESCVLVGGGARHAVGAQALTRSYRWGGLHLPVFKTPRA